MTPLNLFPHGGDLEGVLSGGSFRERKIMGSSVARSQSATVSSQILDVTPEMAKNWLKDKHQNRAVKTKRVEEFAHAMKNGEWRMNGQSIIFSTAGRLLDGQHRLLAIVESGETVRLFVVQGVPEREMVTIDRGTKRSFADVLGIRGCKDPRSLAGAIRVAMALQNGQFMASGVVYSYENMSEWLAVNQKIGDSVSRYASKKKRSVLPLSQVAGLHFLMSKKSALLADDFWDRVIEGDGLSKTDIEYKLRDRLLNDIRANTVHMLHLEKVALCIKAWNFKRAGQQVERLMWKQDGSRKEAFPVIE